MAGKEDDDRLLPSFEGLLHGVGDTHKLKYTAMTVDHVGAGSGEQ